MDRLDLKAPEVIAMMKAENDKHPITKAVCSPVSHPDEKLICADLWGRYNGMSSTSEKIDQEQMCNHAPA